MSSKLVLLVDRLIEKEKAGALKWDRAPNEGVFITSFPDYSISISRSTNNVLPEFYDYKIYISDLFGDIVEEVSDDELANQGLDSSYDKLGFLYESARRKAMGIDRALNSILKFLEGDV